MVRKCIWAAAVAAALLAGGCDEYNRADISDDGRYIGFSYGRKGFATDKSSEIYLFEVERIELTRLTVNGECDAWVDLKAETPVYIKAAGEGVGFAHVSEGPGREACLLQLFANAPLWISKERMFLATAQPVEGRDRIIISFWLYGPQMRLERLVRIPCDDQRTLFSTTPALRGDRTLYYATAENLEVVQEAGRDGESEMLKVDIWRIDLETKAKRRVTTFTFKGRFQHNKDAPVGYVDLAISDDDAMLLCCFLPGKGLTLKGFDDEGRSRVYLVEVETGKADLLSHEGNVYYPQWAPLSAGDGAASQPASGDRRIVFLTGTDAGKGRRLMIVEPEDRPRELLWLPDRVMRGYTGWTWLRDGRLRVFHLGSRGLSVVDLEVDGTERHVRHLAVEQLKRLKERADLEAAIAYLKHTAETVRESVDLPAELEPGLGERIAAMEERLEAMRAEPVEYADSLDD